jgi:DUF2075 family protein
MIIYHATKKQFIKDVFDDTIADNIDNAFFAHLGRHTSPNEMRSWKNSMQYMYRVMDTKQLPDDAGVAIEYQIPLTSKRIDFIVGGNDEYGRGNIVIIELKQWEKAHFSDKPDLVVTRFEHGEAETSHPSYQAWSYAYMLENYNSAIQQRDIRLNPCAYLHNYQDDSIISDVRYQDYMSKAPIFLKGDAGKLQLFLEKHIRKEAKEDLLWLIENGELRPSKQLADSLVSMVKGNPEFVMIDEQKVVYENALDLARKAQNGQKQVLIVQGGPGTGKSVLAIQLMAELTKEGIVCQYVSKNAAPRDVYTAKLSGSFRRTYINNLFVGSGSFIDTPENAMGALIADEAHRLTEKSGMYGNQGENQIREIIHAAKFIVFFIDDKQRIHIRDIGSTKTIQSIAEQSGARVHIMKLESQFRCNGSDGYLSWLDNALQISETANINLSTADYDFRIFDNPNDLFDSIVKKNAGRNKSRLVAGYCWEWHRNDLTEPDIVIPEHDFSKKWNLSNDGNLWIIGEHSINQIGCIHTCQGLELDYVGVILGPDIKYREGRVITDVFTHPSADSAVRGLKSRIKNGDTRAIQLSDEIIKNTYRTLMTRGMKGCYVFCCDKALADHLTSLLTVTDEISDEIRIEASVADNVKYLDFLPYYSLKAACGYFGDGEDVEELGWIRVDGLGRLNRNMFVVKAVGDSMEPKIHDGDYCVFRANPAGSREGKIVLVQNHTSFDPEYGGSYAIKQYSSEKSFADNGTWQHSSIKLKPLNSKYNSINIDEISAEDFRIIGELVTVL